MALNLGASCVHPTTLKQKDAHILFRLNSPFSNSLVANQLSSSLFKAAAAQSEGLGETREEESTGFTGIICDLCSLSFLQVVLCL